MAVLTLDIGFMAMASCPQWVRFEANAPTPPAMELPIPCSGYAFGTPFAIGSDWLATAGLGAEATPELWMLAVDRSGEPSPLVTFDGSRSGIFFGYSLASLEEEVWAPSPGDPSGVAPIRRFVRAAGGSWSEAAPLVLADPGPDCGVALAVAALRSGENGGRRVAVCDATDDDPSLLPGRIRIIDLAADGTILAVSTLRRSVPAGASPGDGLFGGRLFLLDDRLVSAWVRGNGTIAEVLIYRQRLDGSWAVEGSLDVPPPVGLSATRDIAVRGRQIALAAPQGVLSLHARSATGAWIQTGSFVSGDPAWTLGATVAWLGASRLATLASPNWFDAEAWLIDPFTDCDGSGIDDSAEIESGAVADTDDNGLPDGCDRAADLDRDGSVGATDLATLLGRFAAGPGLGDMNDDGEVDASDLALLLGAWGR